MKVKLLEYYNDATHALQPGQEVDVDNTLGAWLVEHRKAVKLEVTEPHYGGQESEELKPRNDEEIFEAMTQPEPQPKKRGRK